MRKLAAVVVTLSMLVLGLTAGCGRRQGGKGTLRFYANGEDFVRQGLVSKDGWSVTFEHVYVSLGQITAYQSDPPYDPHSAEDVQAKLAVTLAEPRTVDLAEGGEDASPILVEELQDVEAGHYNALSWEMSRASQGPASGYSLVIVGEAEKEGRTTRFTVAVGQEYEYTCGEYVGDERKGILRAGGQADLEMTFHLDHIFGDAETPADDELNVGALGFEPFAGAAEGGVVDVDVAGLERRFSADDYRTLVEVLPTLGHVGEGHCRSEAY